MYKHYHAYIDDAIQKTLLVIFRKICTSKDPVSDVIRHGIRHNRHQFLHQLFQVLLVGLTIGMTRTVVPALAESDFGVPKNSFVLLSAFVVALDWSKAS